MPIKKTVKTVKKTASKRTLKPKAVKVADDKEHIVTQKLESVMDAHHVVENTEKPADFVKAPEKKQFPWWGLFSVVLMLVFGTILLYQNNTDFKNNLMKMLNGTGLVSLPVNNSEKTPVKTETFNMKLKIVYNQANADMKNKIQTYINNIEKNLANTKVTPVWYDKNSPDGQEILKKVSAKFVPVFVTDESILKHPQYKMFAAAVSLKNGIYAFQSEGMEYLTIPPYGDGQVKGANPANAKVKIIEYASMTCEYCARMHPIMENIINKYGSKVSWIVKNYDRGGVDALFEQGVECAGEQGKFDQMVTDIYARQADMYAALQNTKTPEQEIYNQLKISAKNAKADGDKVVACVKTGKYSDKIAKQTAEGLDFGIVGTPAFFVNDQFIGGAMEEPDFTKIVENELNK